MIESGGASTSPRRSGGVLLPGGDILREVGLQSVLTVPIVGALGTLGAMQLIRCEGQAEFTTSPRSSSSTSSPVGWVLR